MENPRILMTAHDWIIANQGLLIKYAVNLTAAILTLFIGYFMANMISSGIGKLMRARKVENTIADFVTHVIKYIMLAFVLIAALGRIGVETASFVAVIGAAGLAIGLALQGSLSNFAAGFLLIMFRPIKVGEFIEISGVSGVVQSVQLFTTILTSADNKMIVVPNSSVLNGNIINYSRQETRRVDMTFGIAYSSDLLKAKAILTRLVNEDARVLKSPSPMIVISALADSSVNFAVRPWVKTGDYWDVFFDLNEKVKLAFDAEGIEIPFPQMMVHMAQNDDAKDLA